MSEQLKDVATPLELVKTGTAGGSPVYDLASATGLELVGQRVLRGLFTTPGDLVHRPDWGAGITSYQNEPPTVSNRRRLASDIARFIDALDFVDSHELAVGTDGKSLTFTLELEADGERLVLPEVKINAD